MKKRSGYFSNKLVEITEKMQGLISSKRNEDEDLFEVIQEWLMDNGEDLRQSPQQYAKEFVKDNKNYKLASKGNYMEITAVKRIASEIWAAMQVYDYTSVEMQNILKYLKDQFDINPQTDVLYRAYLIKQNDVSNKYHYFVVFEKDGVFIGANAYGRIGYSPRFVIIDKSADKDSTMSFVKRKMKSKIGGGYSVIEEK